jgi:hypothetical protein
VIVKAVGATAATTYLPRRLRPIQPSGTTDTLASSRRAHPEKRLLVSCIEKQKTITGGDEDQAIRRPAARCSTGLKDQGAYAHQVGNGGDGDALSGLPVM